MDFRERLEQIQQEKKSYLCVGLDSGPDRMPPEHLKDFRGQIGALKAFNELIVFSTMPFVCAYKPNLAFYEVWGPEGMAALEWTIRLIHECSDALVILDAKRGDIGSTAEAYAKASFEVWGADAVTVNAYMGCDAVEPFLKDYRNQGKGVFVLGQTSNPGAYDFQTMLAATLDPRQLLTLSERVAEKTEMWGADGLVVGATIPQDSMSSLRRKAPSLVWLIPGIGAQGGDDKLAMRYGFNNNGIGPVINVSRGVICAWQNYPQLRFDQAAALAAKKLRDQLNLIAGEQSNLSARPQKAFGI